MSGVDLRFTVHGSTMGELERAAWEEVERFAAGSAAQWELLIDAEAHEVTNGVGQTMIRSYTGSVRAWTR